MKQELNLTESTDALLGVWVFVDDPELRSVYTKDFRDDGTVVTSFGDKTSFTGKYRRAQASEWLAKLSEDSADDQPFFQELKKPGAEMIIIADHETGEFNEEVDTLLALIPEDRILFSPIEGYWCRPGDEERVRSLAGMGSRREREELRIKRLREWKSEKDITSRFQLRWQVPMEGGSLEEGLVVRQVDGEPTEIVAPGIREFKFLDGNGALLRSKGLRNPCSHFVLGRDNGNAVYAGFDTWGDELRGFDNTGVRIWSIEVGERGMDWVAPVPIDAENIAFFIGYNGGGGVEMIRADGKSLWKAPVEANVWNVAGARLKPNLPGFGISVGRQGALAFDHAGRQVRTFGSGVVNAVGAGDLGSDGVDEVFTLDIDAMSGSLFVKAFTAEGTEIWSQRVGAFDEEFLTDPFHVGTYGGQRMVAVAKSVAIKFFDSTGKHVGDYVNKDMIVSVARLPQEHGSDLLLVRTESGLLCLELTGSD